MNPPPSLAQPAPSRVVHCAEAVGWLHSQPSLSGCSFVTSLPDVSETPLGLDAWKKWFTDAAALIFQRCPDEGVAIFYQTDIKKGGSWIEKGYLVHSAAEREGMRLLWHKIACRKAPGTVTFGRPAYSHLLCYSRNAALDLARSTADVLPDAGEMTWSRAIGLTACRLACRFVLEQTPTRTIVDPFCGVGTVLAVANDLGLGAIGVDLSRRRAAKARQLVLSG